METLSDIKNRGKASRGATSDDSYHFGDFTRGLIAGLSGSTESKKYGVWENDAEGEFGPSLRSADYEVPLSETKSGAKTVWEVVSTALAKNPTAPGFGYRKLVKVHMVEDGGKKFEKLEYENKYEWITYQQYLDKVKNFGSGLIGLAKPQPQDKIVIYAETQMDWMVVANAAFMMNLQVVTIYATLGEVGALHGLNQSRATVCVADAKLIKILAKIAPKCSSLQYVVSMAACDEKVKTSLTEAGRTVSTLDELIESGKAAPESPRPCKPSDTAVIMYTSGTTGLPKGVVLSHGNLVSAVAGFNEVSASIGIGPQDTFLAYLPLAHIMEMIAEINAMSLGVQLGYGSPHTLTDTGVKLKRPESEGDAKICQPTFMVFAPAVFDKVYKGVLKKVDDKGGAAKMLFNYALGWGEAGFEAGRVGVNPFLNVAFSTVQAALGGKIRVALTGSAPLSPEIQRFMQTVLKAPVRQGYGLTENCACASMGAPDDNTVKSVGGPTPCTLIRLADWEEGGYKNSDKDIPEIGMPRGEVVVGGPTVCQGYYIDESDLGSDGKPSPDMADLLKKNQEEFVVIKGVRYFRTGDVGQVLPNGTLQIIDRKKDLWKGPQGEYVSLSKVEAALKLSPYVEIPMCYGKTGGEWPIALLCVTESAIRKIKEGSTDTPIADLCKDPAVIKKVLDSCKEVSKDAKLVEFEVPKKVVLLPPTDGTAAWTPDNDLLTAAMKLKRPGIVKAFKAEIDAAYA